MADGQTSTQCVEEALTVESRQLGLQGSAHISAASGGGPAHACSSVNQQIVTLIHLLKTNAQSHEQSPVSFACIGGRIQPRHAWQCGDKGVGHILIKTPMAVIQLLVAHHVIPVEDRTGACLDRYRQIVACRIPIDQQAQISVHPVSIIFIGIPEALGGIDYAGLAHARIVDVPVIAPAGGHGPNGTVLDPVSTQTADMFHASSILGRREFQARTAEQTTCRAPVEATRATLAGPTCGS